MSLGYLATTRSDEHGSKRIDVTFGELDPDLVGWSQPLADHEVDVDVAWSDINYKDGLLLAGKPGVSRREQLVPGIDAIGRVRELGHGVGGFAVGDRVLIVGDGLGEAQHGGLAERIRVRASQLIHVPDALELRDAAALGTAGFTAALSASAVFERVAPDAGDVLVTGAAGGVGSIAIMLLAARGYRVVASTGRVDEQGPALRELGAADVVDRDELGESTGKPLQPIRFAAAVDTVGSTTLANALAQTAQEGVVTACGLAQGPDLPTTVMPFILRGVTLRGINSVTQSRERRQQGWDELAADIDRDLLRSRTTEVALADAASVAEPILRGEVAGRTVVRVLGD